MSIRKALKGIALAVALSIEIEGLAALLAPVVVATLSFDQQVAACVIVAIIGAPVAGSFSILAIVRWLNRRDAPATPQTGFQDESA